MDWKIFYVELLILLILGIGLLFIGILFNFSQTDFILTSAIYIIGRLFYSLELIIKNTKKD